jgi:protein-S-isoprenylcysteine O-methyltransferase Ste14
VTVGLAPGTVTRIELPIAIGHVGLVAGCLLASGGLALMVRAQLDLGASWRVGVDEASRPGLVTHGLYRWSRNPIYTTLFVLLGGMLLLMPTWITLLAFVGSVATPRNQVRGEERDLLPTYRDDYRRHAARGGRFVPGLGRIPRVVH